MCGNSGLTCGVNGVSWLLCSGIAQVRPFRYFGECGSISPEMDSVWLDDGSVSRAVGWA